MSCFARIPRSGGAKPITSITQITGTRALVTFALDGNSVIADLEVGPDCVPGQMLALKFDMTKAVLIDPVTARTVAPGSGAGA